MAVFPLFRYDIVCVRSGSGILSLGAAKGKI